MTQKYKSIIDLPHHVSSVHPRMSREERAAQFSPFSALTGYDSVIQEAARLTEEKIELSDDKKAELDRKQQFLAEHMNEQPLVTVTYFSPDEKKDGGAYRTVTKNLKRINPIARTFIMTDGQQLSLDQILDLEFDFGI